MESVKDEQMEDEGRRRRTRLREWPTALCGPELIWWENRKGRKKEIGVCAAKKPKRAL